MKQKLFLIQGCSVIIRVAVSFIKESEMLIGHDDMLLKRTQIWHVISACFGILCSILLASCHSSAPLALDQQVYIWQRQWTPNHTLAQSRQNIINATCIKVLTCRWRRLYCYSPHWAAGYGFGCAKKTIHPSHKSFEISVW